MTFVVSWLPAISDSECLVSPFVVVAAVGNDNDSKGTLGMKIRLGVDIACRSPHHAACADETGTLLWSGHRFRTDVGDLGALWSRSPAEADEVMVVMEPTRNPPAGRSSRSTGAAARG
jgi:hypothetical protein